MTPLGRAVRLPRMLAAGPQTVLDQNRDDDLVARRLGA